MANRISQDIRAGVLCRTESDTAALGRAVADGMAGDRLVLSLEGPLGAGKTCFVGGLAAAVGIRDVSSPTFALVHEYSGGRLPLVHFDLYRLECEDDLIPLGFDEYLREPGICAIEWGGKFPGALPPGTWRVVFDIVPDGRMIRAEVIP
jgi:tRNA threonylcarbamoyladenosine biosynthesis protein TsaE